MKVLLFGSNGLIGSEFKEQLSASPSFELIPLVLADCDILNTTDLQKCFEEHKPNVVINCAGYTNVEKSEDEEELASKINGHAVGEMAKLCKEHDAALLHLSTDYVFDGTKGEPYTEDDKPNPLSAYGRGKLLGEQLSLQNNPKTYVVRTAWPFGKHGPNFVDKIIEFSKTRDEMRIVNDQVGSPTYVPDLVTQCISLLQSGKDFGIYHGTNSGEASWYDLASETVSHLNLPMKVLPCTSDEFPQKAKRPTYSPLANTKLPSMRDWKEALHVYLEAISPVHFK